MTLNDTQRTDIIAAVTALESSATRSQCRNTALWELFKLAEIYSTAVAELMGPHLMPLIAGLPIGPDESHEIQETVLEVVSVGMGCLPFPSGGPEEQIIEQITTSVRDGKLPPPHGAFIFARWLSRLEVFPSSLIDIWRTDASAEVRLMALVSLLSASDEFWRKWTKNLCAIFEYHSQKKNEDSPLVQLAASAGCISHAKTNKRQKESSAALSDAADSKRHRKRRQLARALQALVMRPRKLGFFEAWPAKTFAIHQ